MKIYLATLLQHLNCFIENTIIQQVKYDRNNSHKNQ